MFAMLRLFGFLPGLLQCFKSADFHVQTNWISPMPGRWETVAHKIELCTICCIQITKQGIYYVIDQSRVNRWTISSNPNNHICFGLGRGLIITVKHIVKAAAPQGNPAEVAVFGDGVIGWISRGSENGFSNARGSRSPNEDALQHGLSRDVRENLPWQTRGGHASLDDGDNSWFHNN